MIVYSDKILIGSEHVEVSPFVCVSIEDSQTHELQAPAAHLDLAPISDWLKKERCTQQAQWYKGEDGESLDLTVINCAERTLVPLLKEELYATLSYVWGRAVQPPLDNTNGNRLPRHLPDTIQDSIDVCNVLSIRYLWVDRYCISAESSHLRSLQISRMDEVYQNSFLTIVACAADDPNSGLPGISRRRNPNPCIEVVGLGCIGALSQSIEIHAGIWATRAWTYQEALLSQRQIYFTDKETFFGSADGIQGERGVINKSSLEQFLPGYLRTGYPVPETTSTARDRNLRKYLLGRLHIWECISNYSMRTLSYQGDILNALLGILAYYRRENGVCHLWGIPFSTFVLAPTPAQPTHLDFDLGLRWIVNGPSSRREGFPSWSW
ncbi:heterokaryon incompatibility protein-domain-containing protein, partial [Alternaria rosae]|uniref:heterokaryon incompatibility protein-domain-containing protein n=1 Tax=Alternaria rosae TaxID=1187941 RepID=UPI001E8D3AAC